MTNTIIKEENSSQTEIILNAFSEKLSEYKKDILDAVKGRNADLQINLTPKVKKIEERVFVLEEK
jgi:hypothetical protein